MPEEASLDGGLPRVGSDMKMSMYPKRKRV